MTMRRGYIEMNQKLKTESYQQLGGINSKASPYMTGPMEFLDLSNLDFQTPGSLSQRWGSTQYIGQTYAGPINSLFEFARLDGSSYVVQSFSGGIFYGATTGNCQGISGAAAGTSTQYWGSVNISVIRPPLISGSNGSRIRGLGAYYQGDTLGLIYGTGQGNTFMLNPAFIQSDNTLSAAVLDNFAFLADGAKFVKFDGATIWPVGLPPPLWATNGTADGNGASVAGFGSVMGSSTDGVGFQYGPSLGTYYLFASYVNNRGFEGPIWPLLALTADNQLNASIVTTLGAGSTGLLQASLSIATPLAYGISAINIYSFYEAYNPSIGQTYTSLLSDTFYNSIRARFWTLQTPVLLQSFPASGSTFTIIAPGSSTGGQTLMQANQIGILEPPLPNTYLPLGLTLGITTAVNYVQYAQITSLFPKMIETYQNRLFLAGFSLTPSTVWFSDVAEPEGYAPDFNFEVRTNDGDVVTCLKAYSTKLYIFKQKSFHVLTGDNPNNFFLQEVSDQYGCVNNRCAVIYDDILLFLDRKGVMMWNGASLKRLSEKIQPTFDTMNFSAALTSACMVHDKIRNQILIAIPVNGSSTNNLTVVYDYLIGAWTTYKGVNISAMAQIQGRNTTKNVFYGDQNGRVNWFGPSFLADNGVGFTTYIKSRFLHEMGDSTQKMFRRFYLNTDSPASSTLVFGVNFFADYGTSVVLGTTIILSQFQNRIDFGISGKSLAFEMSNLQSAIPLKVHGFTTESRFLRRT